MSKFFIDCEDLSEEECEQLAGALSEAAVSDIPLTLELLFVSEEDIRSLNARERGIDRVTDVLSFPAADLVRGEPIVSDEHGECVEPVLTQGGWEERMYLGSVVICKKRATEQAAEYGHSVRREIGYLTVHGVLHCLGYDHETEEDKAEMRAKEEEIMQKLKLGRGE